MTGTLQRLGRGLDFPIVPRSGEFRYAEGPEKVLQSIRIILETTPGERVMRPTFGAGLDRYLMKPNTVASRALIRRAVEQALALWEPRIKASAIAVDPGEDPALVLITIRFTHLRDGSEGNLVYPFYLE